MAKRPHPVNEVPMACMRDEDRLRAARLFDPEFFPNLKNDGRKVAVLTLERGFMRVLANAQNGVTAICDMCQEAKGDKYDPTNCTRHCPMFRSQELMETLQTTLRKGLAFFHPPGGAADKGGDKTSPKDGGKDDSPCLVPVG